VINLFPKRADRVRLNDRDHEFHLIPDRSRPMDFEIHQILEVEGFGADSAKGSAFLPFYALRDHHNVRSESAFYTLQRRPRLLSSKQKQKGARSRYLGQEVFISLVDAGQAPYATDLKQLGVKTMCTNRDVPMHMPLGKSGGDFFLEQSAPVKEIRVVAGPTRPSSLGLVGESRNQGASATSGELAWRLINHLSLNFLSLVEESEYEGAAALREMLELYSDGHKVMERQINGILAVHARPVTRRLEIPGPISFGRGLDIVVTLDENAFEAGGMVLFGLVLSEFFRKYVSLNNVTETVIKTDANEEVARWPVKMGRRPEL
jgi:type VI secretion system protein ImpG